MISARDNGNGDRRGIRFFHPVNRKLNSLRNHSAEQNSRRANVTHLDLSRIFDGWTHCPKRERETAWENWDRGGEGWALPLPAIADVAHRSIHPASNHHLYLNFRWIRSYRRETIYRVVYRRDRDGCDRREFRRNPLRMTRSRFDFIAM